MSRHRPVASRFGVLGGLAAALLAGGLEASQPTELPATRAGRLRALREAKARRPVTQGAFERAAVYIEKHPELGELSIPIGDFRLGPGGIRSGGGFGGRLTYWDRDRAEAGFQVFGSASVSTTLYQTYDLRLGKIPHRKDKLPPLTTMVEDFPFVASVLSEEGANGRGFYWFVDAQHRDYRREPFYGLGDTSSVDDRSSFRARSTSVEGVLQYRLHSRAVISARGGWLHTRVQAGTDPRFPSADEVFPPSTVPGLGQRAGAPFGAGELLVDWRDHDVYGERGGMLGVGLTRFGELTADDRFSRLQADLRQVIRLGSSARALALRGYLSLSRPEDGAQVPFYLMEGLGGNRGLRGYDPFRFRGERLMLLQAEYRWEASRTFQLVAFYEAGQAVRAGEDFARFSDLRDSYGGGLRIKTESAILARIELARSDEGTRFVVDFGGVF